MIGYFLTAAQIGKVTKFPEKTMKMFISQGFIKTMRGSTVSPYEARLENEGNEELFL